MTMSIRLVHAFLMLLFLMNPSLGSNVTCIESERKALLQFKQVMVDSAGELSSWSDGDDSKNCCTWRSVSCSNQTGHVLSLDLAGSELSLNEGNPFPSLMELGHLNHLDLSGNYFHSAPIPDSLASLKGLTYLDLSSSNFGGRFISGPLRNLSRLQYLDLSGNKFEKCDENLSWISSLSSLNSLDLSDIDLSKANDWFQAINHLPELRELRLTSCQLPSFPISLTRPVLNFSKHLTLIDLSQNLLEGVMPRLFTNTCSLDTLHLGANNLNGEFTKFVDHFSGCTKMVELNLNSNQISGNLPDFSVAFPMLEQLILKDNHLNGTLSPTSIGNMSNLQYLVIANNFLQGSIVESLFSKLNSMLYLDLSDNSLEGLIVEGHFSNLNGLRNLDLSNNAFILKFRSNWTPPFLLSTIKLRSCNLGPFFPQWLQTQHILSQLDISNASISDTIPSWFWNYSNLQDMNLSHNQLSGVIPYDNGYQNIRFISVVDLSSNLFEGPVPPFLSKVTSLNLSKNRFHGNVSFLCASFLFLMEILDLSSNLLSGDLPSCLSSNYSHLVILNLANNQFSGKIPTSLGSLSGLVSLHLRNNNFTGELPMSMKNCTSLKIVDLGNNKLSGAIPDWLGYNLIDLAILSFRFNYFSGHLPYHLCHLQGIQLLDLSFNNFRGSIPKCFNNLTALMQLGEYSSTSTLFVLAIWHYMPFNMQLDSVYDDDMLLTWKGRDLAFTNTLGLLKSIDLSSNHLTGDIPEEIMELVALVSLNLSRNNLTGHISTKISQLQSLDVLDLSRNRIFGLIPTSLSNLDRLGMLDLSNNNLSGRIPEGTQLQGFDASTYAGNAGLCGLPLPVKCLGEKNKTTVESSPGKFDSEEDDDSEEIWGFGFYVSLGVGFAIGLWGVFGSLIFSRSWRYAYFRFFSDVHDSLYMFLVVKMAKLRRWFKG